MVMTRTQALKHQWQSKDKNTHRVRFFFEAMHYDDVSKKHPHEIFWMVADKFKTTAQAQWVEENGVELKWMEDDNITSWHKVGIIYGDLTESQYVDYSLRFFRHREEWK